MASRSDSRGQRPAEPLGQQISLLAAQGRYRRALNVLDRLVDHSMPLFESNTWMLEERRLAWLYRIDLLRDLGRRTEALAWACLEVEIDPDNVAARALKERLKREAGLLPPRHPGDMPRQGSAAASRGYWNGVAGMRELKAMLERDVILPLQEPEIYALYRLNLPNGILLYGPPGCGKTFLARKLAEVAGFNFMEVTPGDLASIYVHGTQGKIAELFAEARSQVPCMMFFDELDAMAPNRGGDALAHHYASEVNEFLVQLNECGKHRVLVIGATNLPERIDPAVRRPGRLDKKFFVGPPDYEARLELLRLYLAERPQESIDWHGHAGRLAGYTCAEIELVVNEAARMALGRKRAITDEDIAKARRDNPPAHSGEGLAQMRDGKTD